MRDDPPTVPDLYVYRADAEAPAASRPPPAGMPTWPGAAERRQPPAPRQVNATVLGLGASLGANVVLLLALLGLLLLGRPGVSLPGGSTASSPPPGSATRAGLSGPTPTPSPSASPLSLAGWLQVAPSQMQLGCGDGQQTQFAVLANTGPDDVQWQAAFSSSAEQAGVGVSPNHGDLKAGTSTALQIQNRTQAGGQQGVIRFDAGRSDAGLPASLSYTTQGCG